MLLVAFIWAKISMVSIEGDFVYFLQQLALFSVCVFSILLLDFISEKNSLIPKNSYHILFFTLFLIMFPQSLLDSNILLSNVLILLALRRIMSMRSHLKLKKKLLDSSILISLATVLYFWSCLFFVLIFVALFLFRIVDIKNWIVPFVGVLAVAIIGLIVQMVLGYDLNIVSNSLNYKISLDFSTLNSKPIIISATIIFSYFIWSLFFYLKNLKTKPKTHKSSYILILIEMFLAIFILIMAPNKSGAEFIFMFTPLSIILTNYFETVSEKWFKEVLIWILMLTPFTYLVL